MQPNVEDGLLKPLQQPPNSAPRVVCKARKGHGSLNIGAERGCLGVASTQDTPSVPETAGPPGNSGCPPFLCRTLSLLAVSRSAASTQRPRASPHPEGVGHLAGRGSSCHHAMFILVTPAAPAAVTPALRSWNSSLPLPQDLCKSHLHYQECVPHPSLPWNLIPQMSTEGSWYQGSPPHLSTQRGSGSHRACLPCRVPHV